MERINRLANLIRQQGFVCLTGEPAEADRLEMMSILEAAELKILGSLSQKTSFLLVGNGGHENKVQQAKDKGIPIFTIEEFWQAISLVFPES